MQALDLAPEFQVRDDLRGNQAIGIRPLAAACFFECGSLSLGKSKPSAKTPKESRPSPPGGFFLSGGMA